MEEDFCKGLASSTAETILTSVTRGVKVTGLTMMMCAQQQRHPSSAAACFGPVGPWEISQLSADKSSQATSSTPVRRSRTIVTTRKNARRFTCL